MFRNIKRIPRFIDKFRRLWMKMTPHPRQARPDGGVFARFAHRLLPHPPDGLLLTIVFI